MALSGGRVSGSLYILKTGNAEYLVGVFMALFSIIGVLTALSIGRWVDRDYLHRQWRNYEEDGGYEKGYELFALAMFSQWLGMYSYFPEYRVQSTIRTY